MADTRISDLTAATSLSDTHELPVVEGGTNKKVTGAQIKDHTHTRAQVVDFTHTHVQADITDFTHTHTASAITDFGEAVDDRIATTIVAGTNLTGTYNDGANTLTLDVDSHTHTASQVTDLNETVDDRVAGLLVAGTNVTLTYNDPANTLTIAAAAAGSHTHPSTDITDFDEAVGDSVNGLIVAGAGITKTYNDGANTLTLATDLAAVAGFYNVGSDPYNAVLDGSADDRTAFADADLDADSNNGTILVPRGTAKINSNLTLAARIHFAGGVIKPASGVTVTFVNRIFGEGILFDRSLGGKIALTGEAAYNVKAEWFGSVEETALHSLEATTDTFSTNAGTRVAVTAISEGSFAVQAPSMKDNSNCVFGVNLGSAQTVGENLEIALDVKWESQDWDTHSVEDIFEIVVGTSTALGGTTVTAAVSPAIDGALVTQRINLGSLTTVRSVGIRSAHDFGENITGSLTIDNLRFGAMGGHALAEACGAESIILSADYTQPDEAPPVEPGDGVVLFDLRPGHTDITDFRRVRTAPWIVNDGSVDVSNDLNNFLSSGQPGERLVLSGVYWADSRIDLENLKDFEIDTRDATFIRKDWQGVASVSMDTCDGIRWTGGKFIHWRQDDWDGSDSTNVASTTTSGTERVMTAAGHRLRLAITDDGANDCGVGIYPYYRLEQFSEATQALILAQDPDFEEGTVFSYTLRAVSGTPSVLVTYEALEKKETPNEFDEDFTLPVALDSSQTTYLGEKTGVIDLFGNDAWRAQVGDSFRIGTEIITITDWQSSNTTGVNTWTFTRGAFGTTAASHAVGDAIYRVVYTRTITTGASTEYVSPIRVDDRYKRYHLYMQQIGAGTAHLVSYITYGANFYTEQLAEGSSGFAVQSCKNCYFDDQKFEGMRTDAYQQQGVDSFNNHYRNFEVHNTGRQGISFNNGRQTHIGPGIVNGSGRSGCDIEPAQADWRMHDVFVKDLEIWNCSNVGFICGSSSSSRVQNVHIDGIKVTRHGNSGLTIGGRTFRAKHVLCRGGQNRDGLGVWADDFEIVDASIDRSIQIESQADLGDWHSCTASAATNLVRLGVTSTSSVHIPITAYQSPTGDLANGDKVVLRSLTGGAGLSASTEYYIRDWDDGDLTFSLAATLNGSAIDITSDMTAGEVRQSSLDASSNNRRLRGRLVNVSWGYESLDLDPNAEIEIINCRMISPSYTQKVNLTPSEYGKDFDQLSIKTMSGFQLGMERDYFPRSFRGDHWLKHGVQAIHGLSLGGTPVMDFSSLTSRPTTGTLFSQSSRSGAQSATVDLGSAETHGKMLIRVIRTIGSGHIDAEISTSIDGNRYKTQGRLRRMTTATATEPDSVSAIVDVRRFVKLDVFSVNAAATYEAYYEFWPAGNNFSLVPVAFGNGVSTAAVTFPSVELPLVSVTDVTGDEITVDAEGQLGTLNPATTYYYRVGARTWDRGPYQWAAEVSAAPGGANNANRIRLGQLLQGSWVRTGAYASSFTVLAGTVAGTYTQRFDVLRPNPTSRIYYGASTAVWHLGTTMYAPTNESIRDVIMSNATTTSLTASDESGWEPDTAYRVHVGDFSWDAGGYWITSKARTGFTINTANVTPAADHTCHVMIVR